MKRNTGIVYESPSNSWEILENSGYTKLWACRTSVAEQAHTDALSDVTNKCTSVAVVLQPGIAATASAWLQPDGATMLHQLAALPRVGITQLRPEIHLAIASLLERIEKPERIVIFAANRRTLNERLYFRFAAQHPGQISIHDAHVYRFDTIPETRRLEYSHSPMAIYAGPVGGNLMGLCNRYEADRCNPADLWKVRMVFNSLDSFLGIFKAPVQEPWPPSTSVKLGTGYKIEIPGTAVKKWMNHLYKLTKEPR